MNLLDHVRNRRPERKNMPIQLTMAGAEKIEKIGGGGIDIDIMHDIDQNGPSNITEIAARVRHAPKTIERVVQRLIRSGYVKYARGEDY